MYYTVRYMKDGIEKCIIQLDILRMVQINVLYSQIYKGWYREMYYKVRYRVVTKLILLEGWYREMYKGKSNYKPAGFSFIEFVECQDTYFGLLNQVLAKRGEGSMKGQGGLNFQHQILWNKL